MDSEIRQPNIKALRPKGEGYQFVFYGDSCSGVPNGRHEESHARVNQVVARLEPAPQFIIFPGDEIIGLVPDEATLRAQWRYWFDVEMGWLDRSEIPIYHSTGNHTTYNRMSERLFAEVMQHLPQNGPEGQTGLAYFVRQDDLLLVFVHTLAAPLGGEGHIETDWLEQVLGWHSDARWKFVIGHHPAFPVNGYVGTYQRTIGDEYVEPFWQILKKYDVMAYLCSHILAFDVQCHAGVLQITSGGAGTAHRMPEGVEYLHAVQMALDRDGLRYQVLDETGGIRERLRWPPPPLARLIPLDVGENRTPWDSNALPERMIEVIGLKIRGNAPAADMGGRQTLFAASDDQDGTLPLWVGLIGPKMELTVILQPISGRSPHHWFGPSMDPNRPFEFELLFHRQMGPGGILWRSGPDAAWSTLDHRSAWGLERLIWPAVFTVGELPSKLVQKDEDRLAFRGEGLEVVLLS